MGSFILEVHHTGQQPPAPVTDLGQESTTTALATGIIFVIMGIGLSLALLVMLIVGAL